MNNDWKQHLLDKAATPNKHGSFDIEGTDVTTSESNDIICDLSGYSTVVIAGEDALEFMQGQFTNDVAKVDNEHSQLNAFCNNKGRMIVNFRLFQYQQNYFASIKNDLVKKSITQLQKYILRAQVAIQDVSEQLVHLGVSGPNTPDLLSAFIPGLNTETDSVSHTEDYIAIRVSGPLPRYEIFCAANKAITLWNELAEKTTAVSSSTWEYLNIVNGLPIIDTKTSEEFVPQMANMELVNGVSFDKGCYTGQEIVARTHYLGKQKRRTYRIKITSGDSPEAGDQLATTTSTENQFIGSIINSVQTANNTYEALAVIQIKSAESEKLKLRDKKGNVEILKLPYSPEDR